MFVSFLDMLEIYSLPKVRHDENAGGLALVSAVFWSQLVLCNESRFVSQNIPSPLSPPVLMFILSVPSQSALSLHLSLGLPVPILLNGDIQSCLYMHFIDKYCIPLPIYATQGSGVTKPL